MTPAIASLEKAHVRYEIHRYEHNPSSNAYGEEAADKLNVSRDQLFKTLVVSIDKDLFVAVVPVSRQLELKKLAKVAGGKKAIMADKKKVEQATGYILGGVSPLGQKKKLKTVIDDSALNFDTIYVSAGRRGLQIKLSPQDLAQLTDAVFNAIGK